MHRSVALVALLSACTASQARKVQSVTQWTLAGSLGAMLATLTTAYAWPGENPVLLDVGLAFVPVAIGSAFAYAAVDGMVQNAEPPVSERDRARETAWQLARDAKHAARAGDCAQVQAIEPRVRDLDQEIYGRFLRDNVIRTCLGPQEAPAHE